MTLMHWAMLLIGLAIGGLACVPFMFAFLKKAEEDIIYYHKWSSNFADLTDRQYKNLENHVDKHFEIIDNYMNRLADISSGMSNDNSKHMKNMLDILVQDQAIKGVQIDDLSALFEEHIKVNDDRWGLIVDYITSDGVVLKPPQKKAEDLCSWCKNQRTEKCADCNEPVSSTEVYFVNYEPKEEDKDNG